MIKCLLSRPGLISGPLKPKPKLILTQFKGLTLSTPSLVYLYVSDDGIIDVVLSFRISSRVFWQEMVGRVNTKAGTEMASDLVRLVWDICRFEGAWYYYQDPEIYPVWCSLFSDQDLELFQFSEDLKYYYDNGPVFNITTLMTQPMFEVCKVLVCKAESCYWRVCRTYSPCWTLWLMRITQEM